MNRRKFITNAGLLLGATTLGVNALANSEKKNKYEFGIILSSLKEEMQENLDKTLKKLAKAGYKYIEGAGRYKIPEKETLAAMKKYGLTSIATGDSMYPLSQDTDKYIDQVIAQGAKYLVCYWPWMDSADNLDKKQCLETAENLEKIGKKCHERGIQFAWHNHNKEFMPLENGQTAFEIIMENTSEYVKSELDVYWVEYAGVSAIETIEKYKNRIGLLHLKDMIKVDGEMKNTAPGKGTLDFASIISKKEEAGIDYLIVEFAGDDLGLDDAVSSIKYLKNL